MRAAERPVMKPIPCPRCQSMNTKFCYYNNYSVNQPRHFCRNCQRYWTVGGTLRNVPVGGGTRKKVHRTRQRMSSSDGLQPRDSRGDFSPAAGAGLNALNMTQVVQSNVLLPSTLQNLVTTQQQLSLLSSQMTGAGGKVGSMSRTSSQYHNNHITTFSDFFTLFVQLGSSARATEYSWNVQRRVEFEQEPPSC
jgi:hypothetical protein